MPRIKLNPLPHYPFAVEIGVRITDCNYGGHLGNDRLLALIHEARVAFLQHHGYSEMDCGGVALILADVVINYKNEAFPGDVLVFEVAAGEPTRNGFRLFFRVTRKNDGAIIALVENGMVCFDYRERKIQPLPETVRRTLTGSTDEAGK
jgi:acyl-CoA thioesterase FadM